MIIAAIPARSGSKGIPDKNIVDLGGKPLLAWSIEVAREVREICNILVVTDSGEYGSIANKFGAAHFPRSEESARDDAIDYIWVKELIDRALPDHFCHRLPLLVHLRPTTPLRNPRLISLAITLIKSTPEATSLRSVHEMSESAWKSYQWHHEWLFPLAKEYHAEPRQYVPSTYHPNGYVDIYRVEHILKHGELYGDKILAFETPRVVEIDTPGDLEYVRWQVEHGGFV